jgi:hypothetical protein
MSDYLRLNWNDFSKGILTSVLSSGLTSLYVILAAGGLPTNKDLKTIGITALASITGYLMKNLFSNASGTVGPIPTTTTGVK